MGLRRFLFFGLLALLVAAPVAAQSGSGSDFYPYRGYCGLAAVSIRLFGYAETVSLGAALSGAPASYVTSFISWCGSRGVGGDDAESAPPEKRECTFSTECPKSCSRTDILQESCVNYKCVPPASVETRCELQSTTVASYSFPNTCTGSGAATACGKDTAAIQAKKSELQKEFNELNSVLRPALSERHQKAVKICLNGLRDVTNQLIVETANTFRSLPTKLIDVISDNTGRLIDAISGQIPGVQPTDTQKEFYLNMCLLEKQIKETDMPLLDKKAGKLQEEIRALDAAL